MIDYESMSDFEINKAVAESKDLEIAKKQYLDFSDRDENLVLLAGGSCFDPCNDPQDAWPIIVDEEISISPIQKTDEEIGMAYSTGAWSASCQIVYDGEICLSSENYMFEAENPLRAAMIVYLMMNEVEQ